MAASSIDNKMDKFTNQDDEIFSLFQFDGQEENGQMLIDTIFNGIKFGSSNINSCVDYISNSSPLENLSDLKENQTCELVNNGNFTKRQRSKSDDGVDKKVKLEMENAFHNLFSNNMNSFDTIAQQTKEEMYDIDEALDIVCGGSLNVPMKEETDSLIDIKFEIPEGSNNVQSTSTIVPLENNNLQTTQLSNLALLPFNNNLDISESKETKVPNYILSFPNFSLNESNILKENNSIKNEFKNIPFRTDLLSNINTVSASTTANSISMTTTPSARIISSTVKNGVKFTTTSKPPIGFRDSIKDKKSSYNIKKTFKPLVSTVVSENIEKRRNKIDNIFYKCNESAAREKTASQVLNVPQPMPRFSVINNLKKRKPREVYSCEKCKFNTKWKKNYNNHIKSEHMKEGFDSIDKSVYIIQDDFYVCQICCCIYGTENSFYFHYKQNHSKTDSIISLPNNPINQRGYSDADSKYTSVNNSRIAKTDVKKLYVCTECHYVFETKILLLEHYIIHKNVTVCVVCNLKCSCHAKLEEHIMISHLNLNSFACYICDKKFKLVRYLKAHLKNHDVDIETEHICPHCSNLFSTQNDLFAHTRSRSCRQNNSTQVNVNIIPDELAELPKATSIIKSRICNQCGITTTTNIRLAIHLQTCFTQGTKIPRNTCPLCYETFGIRKKLLIHLLRHNKYDFEENSNSYFQCPKCRVKSFPNKYLLSEHSLTCLGEELDIKGHSTLCPIVISDSE